MSSNSSNSTEEKPPLLLCLGTGRFLRSVLVPPFVAAGGKTIFLQPRGRSFGEFLQQEKRTSYPIDTVLADGSVQTEEVPCDPNLVFSLGDEGHAQQVFGRLLQDKSIVERIVMIGVGVTEAGLASANTPAMEQLYKILKTLSKTTIYKDSHRLCVINTDNVAHNGQVLQTHMQTLTSKDDEDHMQPFLQKHVAFLDSMVDRITAIRPPHHTDIPWCEPLPAKALVLLDEQDDLPLFWSQAYEKKNSFGVVIRRSADQLDQDIQWKLRIANGTHTAVAHGLALCGSEQTTALSQKEQSVWKTFLQALVQHQILPAAAGATDVWEDWYGRLLHAHFGLSTFFITQNGAAKGGIRWGPTMLDLLSDNPVQQAIHVSFALAYAMLLRWLTPANPSVQRSGSPNVYTGWLDGRDRQVQRTSDDDDDSAVVVYADGLKHNLSQGWYEFKCACTIVLEDGSQSNLATALAAPKQDLVPVVQAYLTSPTGGNLGEMKDNAKLHHLAGAIAVLYQRLVAGDGIAKVMQEMADGRGVFVQGFQTPVTALAEASARGNGQQQPLHFKPASIPDDSKVMSFPVPERAIRSVVTAEVQSTEVIDLHTHLLPPTHGPLCLWGIDELLTYHYLVAEYFMTAPASVTPESFYAQTKQQQANLIWQALFLDRTPISEACRGVVTVLVALGLEEYVKKRDLEAIRSFYQEQYRSRGEAGARDFCEMIFQKSGIRYAIMTNIPFEALEVKYWRPLKQDFSSRFRSALRVDPLLTGDRSTIESTLSASGYETTLEGARQYLRDWCDTMQPEYMMASTPHDFVLPEGTLAQAERSSRNPDAMQQPFAFANVTNSQQDCNTSCQDDAPTVIDETSDFLSEVLMKVCEERDLPVALKIGAHRGVNPQLKAAGDGVVAFADAGVLARLCTRFPKIRFLATFLSRNNQHEACVLASKFRNLHLYGCWWFCNNPSMIKEITHMRTEMLGTAFTAQHSDARVVDQLLYKWPHTRRVLAEVLGDEYEKLAQSGWLPTRGEIRRDVARVLRGSYEDFMKKSLLPKATPVQV